MIVGLAISIPIVIFGATLLVKLMERFPVIITIGAALIGFVAGEMAWEDHAIAPFTSAYPADMKYAVAMAAAALVVAWGQWLAKRAQSRTAQPHKVSESNPAR
jgi:predicted tellurium resistance membrane protein TerC